MGAAHSWGKIAGLLSNVVSGSAYRASDTPRPVLIRLTWCCVSLITSTLTSNYYYWANQVRPGPPTLCLAMQPVIGTRCLIYDAINHRRAVSVSGLNPVTSSPGKNVLDPKKVQQPQILVYGLRSHVMTSKISVLSTFVSVLRGLC